jgi:hypothetical protein
MLRNSREIVDAGFKDAICGISAGPKLIYSNVI